MTGKERQKYLTEIASDLILKKASAEEIRAALEQAGANVFELSSVVRESERLIYKDLREKISLSLQKGIAEEQFPGLMKAERFPAKEELERLVSEEKTQLINRKLQKINSLIRQDRRLKELLKLADRLVSEDDIRAYYEKTKAGIQKAENEDRKLKKRIGMFTAGTSFLLSVLSYAFSAPAEIYVAFSALLIYGFTNIISREK